MIIIPLGAIFTGLQAGMALTALYFTFMLAVKPLTKSVIYWVFFVGVLALLARYIQLILTFAKYQKAFTLSVLLLNTILPLCLALGFGFIYQSLRQKDHE